MELGGALAEEGCGVEVAGGVFADGVGSWCGEGCDFVEEAVEVGEGPGPAVAYVGGEGLEEGEGGVVGGEVEVAEVGGDVVEVGDLGEEAGDFYVGIFAGGDAAEEFEDGEVVVEDAGVGLLGGAEAGGDVGEARGVECGGVVGGDVGGGAGGGCGRLW